MFDRNGSTHLYQFSDPLHGVRNPVSLDQMSPYLVAATIATEDPSFYGNPGVNFRGLARAAFENLTPFGPGFFAGSGGSSISQQLARNVYVDPAERSERSISRKMKETVIALELKKRYQRRRHPGVVLEPGLLRKLRVRGGGRLAALFRQERGAI